MPLRHRDLFPSLMVGLLLIHGAGAHAQYGQLDATFGNGGYVVPDIAGYAFSVAVQPDGRIVATGARNGLLALLRLLPNGAPDPSFGTNGEVALNAVPNGITSEKLLLLPGGGCIVAGYSMVSGADYQLALARCDEQGALVTTFGTGGVAQHNEGPGSLVVRDAALDVDGRIVVCATTGFALHLARCLPDGALDPAFDGDGWAQLVGFLPSAMAIDAMGRILVCNANDSRVRIARFLANGALDAGFGDAGIVEADLLPGSELESPFALKLMPDGRMLVAGVAGGTRQLFVERHDAAGALDPLFGTGGRYVLLALTYCNGGDMLRQPDGAIVVAAEHQLTNDSELALLRLTPGGAPDPTWGTDGLSLLQVEQYERPSELALQPDGRLMIAGEAQVDYFRWMLARVTTGLSVDVEELPGGRETLTVFPVPARDRCTVLLPAGAHAVRTVELVDAAGRVLELERFPVAQERLTLVLPERLAPGAYALRVQLADRALLGRLVRE